MESSGECLSNNMALTLGGGSRVSGMTRGPDQVRVGKGSTSHIKWQG